MNLFQRFIGVSTIWAAGFAWAQSAQAAGSFAPTSFEVFYQPTYSMATGGPTAQLGPLGGGIRIGYAMVPQIAFELSGYYDGYCFGNIGGANVTAYAPRAMMDFAYAPARNARIYAGVDANVFINPPSTLTSTNKKDIGVAFGTRALLGGGTTKVAVGAEYRYAPFTALTYAGGTINTSAVIGTVGLHFGEL